MVKLTKQHILRRFILRRAIWKGEIKRSEVMNAFKESPFNVAPRTATEAMDNSVLFYPNVLERGEKSVRYIKCAKIPKEALASTLLKEIEEGRGNFWEIGLDFEELQIIAPRKILELPGVNGEMETCLEQIFRAIIGKKILNVLYVGLKKGESAKWRSLLPVALETYSSQRRLIAHDMDNIKYPQKSFVFSRILKVTPSNVKKPRKMNIELGSDKILKFKVKFNLFMSSDQKIAIKKELGIDESGVLEISSRDLFDFRRHYVSIDPRDDEKIVWPLISEMTQI